MALFIENKKEYRGMSCVYRLTFDGGYFYVGSTKNLFTRLGVYNSIFRDKKVLRQSKSIIEMAKTSKTVELEIISETSRYLSVELKYIFNNRKNHFLLNRNIKHLSNKGIKWTKEEKEKVSIKMKSLCIKRSELTKQRRKQKIHKIDPNGNVVGEFSSYNKAAIGMGCSRVMIAKVVNGIKDNYKGFVFKYAS